MAFRVAVIDHRFPNLDPETTVLSSIRAELLDLSGLEPEEILERSSGVDAVLLGARFQFDRNRLACLNRCRVIVRYGVGVDNVDLDAARRLGLLVCCVPDYCVEEVSNHA